MNLETWGPSIAPGDLNQGLTLMSQNGLPRRQLKLLELTIEQSIGNASIGPYCAHSGLLTRRFMEVSINGGTGVPLKIVGLYLFIMENLKQKWMRTRGTPMIHFSGEIVHNPW
jgi:hypothetical protein